MTPIEAKELIGRKVLITVDNWFYAPDGRQYRAVFGTLVAIQTSEQSLGVKVSARSQDWYMTVGGMKIAGCQIHYAMLTEQCQKGGTVTDWSASPEKGYAEFQRPNAIFHADDLVDGSAAVS